MSTTVRSEGSVAVSPLFRRILDQGQGLAESLERGQAEMPLVQHFRSLQRLAAESPFTVCVLGLSLEARTQVLRWLVGNDFSLLTVEATRNLGLLELTLRERGYVLEGRGGGRLEFDQFESFIGALKEADLVREGDSEGWIEPLRLSLPSAAGLQGLRLLMPENPNVVVRDIAVSNRIARECNALVVAAEADRSLDDTDRAAVEAMVAGMDAVWPLVILEDAAQSAALPARGWWHESVLRPAAGKLSPLTLSSSAESSLPAFLREAQNPLRKALFNSQMARGLLSAVAALSERADAAQKQYKTRRQKEERNEKLATEVASDSATRSAVEGMRTFLQDEFAALQKGVQDLNRKALLAEGALASAVDEALKTLQITDLSQTPGHKTTQLTVSDHYLGHLTNGIRRGTKEQLSKDLVMVRDGLRVAQAQFEKLAEKSLGAALRVDFYPPDERGIREVIGEVLKLQIRYKGEMPKRGFMQRMAEGRRLLFAALMTLSLFIGLLTGNSNVRSMLAPFGILFLLVFAGGVAWTYSSWKKEDAERLEKEVDKVKEQLRGEVQRLLAETQREKLSRLNDHLEQLRREVVRRLDDFARQVSQQRGMEQGKERQAARERIRVIDQRIKALDGLRSSFQKLDQDCNDLKRECEKELRSGMDSGSAG